MDWKKCLKKRIAKEINKDDQLIKSLTKTSNNKIESEEKLELNLVTSCSKISLTYDSLRELLEALAISYGYKIYNHECYTYFLKEVLNKSSEGDEFDELRKLRNNINYYGKEITTTEAKDVIKRIKKLRIFVLKLLK